MATKAAELAMLLQDNVDKFEGLSANHVHAFMIPQDDTSTDVPILVINEVPMKSRSYANNTPLTELGRIQLTYYCPPTYEGDIESLARSVETFLLSEGYALYSSAGWTMTPDSQNLTNTYKFNYIKDLLD
jgi:hypothetical protein